MPTQSLVDLSALLGNDFEDIRPLGADGGLSRLFRARKISLGMDVVIKQMKADHHDPASVKREAKILTGLRHQFLPRILDFKTDEAGWCYTIMELIPGCSLREYVRKQGALSQKQTLHWMRQLAQALEYMHGHNPVIIHSDIKPENIMITPEGDLCLIDFNASLEMRDTPVQAVGATPCYAAPEQYNIPLDSFGSPDQMTQEVTAIYTLATRAQDKGPVTVKTDLYAVGAVAYFMITGYDPKPWCEPQIPLVRYSIALSDPLRQVIERCMQVEASQRFSSAKELLRALNNLARMDQKYKNWRRSCRTAALTVGAGMILSAFCCLWGVLLVNRQNAGQYNQLIDAAQTAAQQLDYEQEHELLMQAVQMDRKRPEAYANLGASLYRMGDYDQAIQLLSGLTPEDSKGLNQSESVQAQGQIQYVLGCCYYQKQDYVKAMPCYQLAAGLCPDEPGYQRDLAICYAQLGYDDKARQAVETLQQMDIRPGDGEFASGEIAYAAGRLEDALVALEAAVKNSEDASVINRSALRAVQCYQELGQDRMGQAVELLRTAANRLGNTENYRVMQVLAQTLLDQDRGNAQEALDLAEELIQRGSPSYSVQETKALALWELGRIQEAVELLEHLAQQYTNDYHPDLWLALMDLEKQPFDQQTFRTHFERAMTRYTAVGAFDGNMERLRERAAGILSK